MDFSIDVLTILGLWASGTAIFVSLFFVLKSRFKNDGYLLLYFVLFLLGYEVFYKTLIHSRFIIEFPFIYQPGRFFNLIIYPLLFIFIWSVIKQESKLERWLIAMLALFIGYTLFSGAKNSFIPMFEKIEMLKRFYADSRPGPFNYWANPKTLIKSTIIPLIFLGFILHQFYTQRAKFTTKQNKRLVQIVSISILLYFLFSQFSNLLYIAVYKATGYSMTEWPVDIVFLSALITLFSSIILSANSGSTLFPLPKYAGSKIGEENYETIVKKAREIVERNQLHLKEHITLPSLAEQIGTNPKYLSQAINHFLGLNFTDFINIYRVEEAKKQLVDSNNKVLTLEAIGNMCGFNSKSAFFRAFKKATGMTPNQYIRSAKSTNS